MEIRDYLSILGRRMRILVLVPAVAVVLVVGSVLAQPTKYAATATAAPTALVGGVQSNQYSGANGLKAFVANFTAASTSPRIIQAVSARTHVRRGAVKSGITTQQVGTSSMMQVTYKTTNRRQAEPVAREVAAQTMVFLFQSQVTLAQAPVDGANKELSDSEAAIDDLIAKVGMPEKAYEIKADEISHLQESQAQAVAIGNSVSAAHYADTIKAKQGELNALAPQVQQYQSLLDRKNQALSALNQARQALRQAQAQFQAADPAQVVSVGHTHPVSVLGDAAQKGAVALGASVFLAIGLIVVLEVLLGSPDLAYERAGSAAPPEPVPSGA